jgi:glycosyltransferase involved in cell wall biosynthesis
MVKDGRTILNFTRIATSGGGFQNALSFIELLPRVADMSRFVAVCNRGRLAEKAVGSGIDVIITRRWRGYDEMDFNCVRRFSKGDVCFTFFGHPWRRSRGYLINVCGVALSNLFYPEVPFWAGLPKWRQYGRAVVDGFRYTQLRFADYWVFETDVLAKRAIDLAAFPRDRVSVVRMSPSVVVLGSKVGAAVNLPYSNNLPPGYRLLFLASAHPNKRIHLAAPIVRRMNETLLPNKKVMAVTTLSERTPYWRVISRAFRAEGIEEYLVNVGPVDTENVSSLVRQCDVMCLFSVLESFSNNLVEAWAMNTPLAITDADWARDAAGDSAIYLNPCDSRDAACKLAHVLESQEDARQLCAAGLRQLANYPSGERKTLAYLQELEIARQMGFVKESERGEIRQWGDLRSVERANR